MRATVRGEMISDWRGSFIPIIGVSKLILQSLEWIMLIPTILVILVIVGMKLTLQNFIKISQRRLLTTGGLKEGHEETSQGNQ